MEERIPHIRTICEKFLTEGRDVALKYARAVYERDLSSEAGISVESQAINSTLEAIREPWKAAELIGEIFDWICIARHSRKIRVTLGRSGGMIVGDESLSVFTICLQDVPGAILRWTELRPGDGAAGVMAAFNQFCEESDRDATARAKSNANKLRTMSGPTWEYKILYPFDKLRQDGKAHQEDESALMSSFGADGWEITNVVCTQFGKRYTYLRRQLPA